MIVSASRRTDIPAFYPKWFMNRLEQGYVLVKNPMNRKQVSRVPLSSNMVECIVFWTKNPKPLLPYLNQIDEMGYKYYFQITLTSYDTSIESYVPKKTTVIETFKKLSSIIGREKVIWRYDPIVITDKFSHDYHLQWFEYIAKQLSGYTEKCVVSFLDMYKKCERNMKDITLNNITNSEKIIIAGGLAKIANRQNIILESCAGGIDLNNVGISNAKCINDQLISRITGREIEAEKDKSQRNQCACVESVDIGSYNCCRHNCLYCYANYSKEFVERNTSQHNPNSALLYGELTGDERISDKKVKSLLSGQLSLF